MHGRVVGIRFILLYLGVDFEDDIVSLGGFVMAKVTKPKWFKYGSVPKLTLENGTVLHQAEAIMRYLGNRFKGPDGGDMYPPADELMARMCVDIALAQSNAMIQEFLDAYANPFGKGWKQYDENARKYMAENGPFEKHVTDIEGIIELAGNKKFMCADYITIGDLAWFGQVYKIAINECPHEKQNDSNRGWTQRLA